MIAEDNQDYGKNEVDPSHYKNETSDKIAALQACQVSYKERLHNELTRYENERSRVRNIRRLIQLLEKNPEIAEIFELRERLDHF